MSNSRIEGPPVSLEASRRKVMGAIHAVERETDVFLERYNTHIGDHTRWPAYINSMSSRLGRQGERVDDFKDIEPLLQRAKGDADLGGRPEYAEVRRMVERGKMFEYISFSLRNDLMDAYEKHLAKYCISFHQEAKGEDLNSVRDYENRVIEWDEEVRAKLERVDNLLDQVDSLKMPLKKYISEYTRVLHLMEETCRAMVAACEPMKRWAVSDANYPRRLQEEINQYNKRKNDLKDVTKTLEYQRDQQGLQLKRRAFYTLKLERMLQDAREEKNYYKKRERTVRENMARNEAEIQRKRQDLNEVRARIKNRQENSPAVYNYLAAMAESLREDIRKLSGKNDAFHGSINNLKVQQDKSQKEVDRLSAEVDRTRHSHESCTNKLQKEEHDLQLVRNEIKRLDHKIETLKKIREIKIHSDTIKKIYHHGYNPGQILDPKDDLTSAFQIASQDVGKDWTWLYQKLPFNPPRDFKERTHDLEVIDIGNRRVDAGFPHLTMKCLEKWRRLSTMASVNELVNTLKRMKKRDAVRRIQREVLRPNSSPSNVTTVTVHNG